MATTGTAGQLHTGGVAPATTAPAATTGVAPPAKRGLLGGRKHNETAVAVDGPRSGGFRVNPGARIGLALAQLLTAIAFIIVLGGLSSLQHRANNLTLLPQQAAIYIDSFQSGNQIPYPQNGSWQFSLAWWTLMFEIFIFLMIFVLLVMPRHLLRLKHTAMCFLVYVFVLTTLQVDSLLYFSRSPTAGALFGTRRVKVTLVGAIMGCIANALSIIFLGLLRDDTGHVHHGAGAHARGGKRVGDAAAAEPVGPAAV